MKKVILPADSDLSGLPVTDNTGLLIVRLLGTMPPVDRLALGIQLGARAVRVTAEPADLDRAIVAQPVEVLRGLAKRHFSRAALRQHELNQRDACYRALAGILPPKRGGYAIAQAIRAEMRRYRDGAWRFDRARPAPADPRRALMHRIFELDGGEIRSRGAITRALAATRSKSAL